MRTHVSDNEFQRIEVITGTARRQRCSNKHKLHITEERCEPGETVPLFTRFQTSLSRIVNHPVEHGSWIIQLSAHLQMGLPRPGPPRQIDAALPCILVARRSPRLRRIPIKGR